MSKNYSWDCVKVNYNGNGNKIGIDMIDFNPLNRVGFWSGVAVVFSGLSFILLYFVTGDWAVAFSGLLCVLGIVIVIYVVRCVLGPIWAVCRLVGWPLILTLIAGGICCWVLCSWPEILSAALNVVSNFL